MTIKKKITKEPQYQCCLEFNEKYGMERLGLMSSHTWLTDPKRLVFVLARYKFVAKMFSGMPKVLEIGCADGFGTHVVNQEVGSITAIDFDPVFIEDAKGKIGDFNNIDFKVHDIIDDPIPNGYDGAYCLDVIEHIPREKEQIFIANIVKSIHARGVLILGTPSIQSQAYASPASKEGHINCKDHEALKTLLNHFFYNVFVFSMNDEIVHTGFYSMAQYLIALCCHPKKMS